MFDENSLLQPHAPGFLGLCHNQDIFKATYVDVRL